MLDDIRNAAAKDPVAKALFQALSNRERAKPDLSVAALERLMREEGFKYGKAECEKALELLAKLGIGKLQRDARGRPAGLTGIQVKLYSVGKAALKKSDVIEDFEQRQRGKVSQQPVQRSQAPRPGNKVPASETLRLSFSVDGENMELPIPEDYSDTKLLKLVKRLRGRA